MKFGRTFGRYLYAYLIGGIVMWFCHFLFLRTLCCVIFGADYGLFAAAVVQYLGWPLIAFWVIYVSKSRDIISKQEYLHSTEGKTYSFVDDAAKILGGSVFWKEVAIVPIISIVYFIINPLLLILNLPLFFVFNLWAHVHLHRKWSQNRLRDS